jgi:glycosyltransferase involved in cell wall biosynthesis
MCKPNTISVIIPVFNGAGYIAAALDSVFNQNYNNIEVIVVNDGSTDNSENIIKSYDIRYLKQENLGVTVARNNGIKISKGEFLAFLDQDDVWKPDKLSLQYNQFLDQKNLGYVLSHQIIHLENGFAKPNWLKSEQLNQPIIGYLPSTLMVRTETFKKIGYFNEKFDIGSDSEWFFRAKGLGIEMKIMQEVLVHRLIHNANQSHSVGDSHMELLRIVKQALVKKRQKGNDK